MATARADLNANDLMACAICFENMLDRQPRSLGCLHSFCQACLEHMVINRQTVSISCPLCQRTTNIPAGGVTNLPVDFKLQQMKDLLATAGNKENCAFCVLECRLERGTWLCKECEYPLCQGCKDLHNRKLEGHTLTQIAEIGRSVLRCGGHNRVTKYFCLECKIHLCPACLMVQNHAEHRDKIILSNTDNEQKLDTIRVKLEEELNMQLNASDTLRQIEEQIREVRPRRVTQENVDILLNELQILYKPKVEESLRECLNCLETLHKTTDMLRKMSPLEKLRSLDDIKERIKTLSDKTDEFQTKTLKLSIPRLHPVPQCVGTFSAPMRVFQRLFHTHNSLRNYLILATFAGMFIILCLQTNGLIFTVFWGLFTMWLISIFNIITRRLQPPLDRFIRFLEFLFHADNPWRNYLILAAVAGLFTILYLLGYGLIIAVFVAMFI